MEKEGDEGKVVTRDVSRIQETGKNLPATPRVSRIVAGSINLQQTMTYIAKYSHQ